MELTSKRLTELKRLADSLRLRHENVQDAITQEQKHLALKEFGVSTGTIVVDKQGKKYRVTEVDVGRWYRPWVSGNPMKKDGTYGTAVRNLYSDWTIFKEDK